MKTYQESIKEHLSDLHCQGEFDPRHIEAFMRLENSTLDGLSKNQFEDEIDISLRCILESGFEQSETLAKSFNL